MYVVGWLVAMSAIAALSVGGAGWAVAVLSAGAALVLLMIRGVLPRPESPPLPTAPVSVDVEARQIRRFEPSDEKGPERDL